MYTKEQFETVLSNERVKMSEDKNLTEDARRVLFASDKYMWIHQTKFFGETCLQLPHDLFAIQEIIYSVKPDYVIELGVAWGGSILFYASILESIGHGTVIGVDKFIPSDLRERLMSKGQISSRLTLKEMDTLNDSTIQSLHETVPKGSKVVLIIDACHTKDAVLKELIQYSDLVNKDSYIICGSTIIENKSLNQIHRDRPWGVGNNPLNAVQDFLKINNRFKIDEYFDQKLLMSCNPGGYLKCIAEV